jgi:general secretion pathway protein K
MMAMTRRRERGIALIQVLLVTGIIALLMLQMGLTARDQVARAQALSDRAALQLATQSREAALVYSLLTEPLANVPESENPYAAAWNFQGDPFTVDGITFSIQDESGRMRVPNLPGNEFEQLLLSQGVAPTRARKLNQELMGMQGVSAPLKELGTTPTAQDGGEAPPMPPGLYPLQDLGQLRLLPGMDPELYRRLRPLLTLYPTPGFNPTTARPALLKAQMTTSQVTGVKDVRDSGGLDSQALWKLTGVIADESTVLAPGPALTVRLEMDAGEARVLRTTTFIVRPYASEPLAVWQQVRGEDEGGRTE